MLKTVIESSWKIQRWHHLAQMGTNADDEYWMPPDCSLDGLVCNEAVILNI